MKMKSSVKLMFILQKSWQHR